VRARAARLERPRPLGRHPKKSQRCCLVVATTGVVRSALNYMLKKFRHLRNHRDASPIVFLAGTNPTELTGC
jgi:hypothetical protein